MTKGTNNATAMVEIPVDDAPEPTEPSGKELRNLAELFLRASSIYEDTLNYGPDFEGRRDFGSAVYCALEEVTFIRASEAEEIVGLLHLAVRGIHGQLDEFAEHQRLASLGIED